MQHDAPFATRRPRAETVHALGIGLGYFVAASAMMLFARFDGGVAGLWIASSLLIAAFSTHERQRWPRLIAACLVAHVAASCLFGIGPKFAVAFALLNLAEAVIPVIVLRRLGMAHRYLDSIEGTGVFAGAVLASAGLVALPAAALSAWATGLPFRSQLVSWAVGHGLGALTFAPVFWLLLRGEFGAWLARATVLRRIEAAILFAAMAATAMLVFDQAVYPMLFLPMLPLMIITFRLEQIGTASAVVILALIGGTLTMSGAGPLNLIRGDVAEHARLFMFYLAVTLMTVLPVAAQLKQRRELMRQVSESEARYKLITESATDMIVVLDRSGIVRYASPSAREVTGFDAADLIGHPATSMICGPDRAILAAVSEKVQWHQGRPEITEYTARLASGELRWFEAHTRATIDDMGRLSGWVSAIRDVSERKALEQRLAHAAATDPLTGLANRRRFDAVLDAKIKDRRANAGGGCLALFDIDFFKRVNDAHGHAVGDQVLETFAAAALRSVRANDHVGRLGGEEFGVILDGATLDQAAQVCERIRQAIARDITRTADGTAVMVTVSAGLVEIAPDRSRLQLMRAADEALYRAKADGRDRLALAA